MMVSKSKAGLHVGLVCELCLSALAVPGIAHASSYADLIGRGYRIGPLTQSRGGAAGWILRRGDSRYFCHLGVSLMLSGKNGMVSMSASGRQVRINKRAFENFRGGPDPSLPHLEDLNAGRPRPQDVGYCTIY